ncbi:MAG TPA: hypothetical protein VJS15_08145 [Allosphingosinicella sp.]|nr:hypothetical protein [Allosphingosinicella sp.]
MRLVNADYPQTLRRTEVVSTPKKAAEPQAFEKPAVAHPRHLAIVAHATGSFAIAGGFEL